MGGADPRRGAIRVLIAADVRFYREGIAQILPRDERMSVPGTAASREELLAQTVALNPDVILLDTSLPDGLAAAIEITRRTPTVKIVALALAETEQDVLEWAEAGVAGYVSRDSSLRQLIDAVDDVMRGEQRCSPRIAASLLRRIATLAGGPTRLVTTPDGPLLTRRELEIIRLIERDMSNKEIAKHLGIGIATAKNHVHNILEKLHLRRRHDAAAWIRRQRIGSHLAGVGGAVTGPV